MLNIVFVDDELDLLKLFKLRLGIELKKYPHQIQTAISGSDCLEVLKNLGATQNNILVISDINMPQMSGFELLEKIRSQFPQVSTYVCTAYDTPDFEKMARTEGAMRFFTKPLSYERLGQAIITDFKDELSLSAPTQ